jgi:hypothetical protein
MNVFYPVVKMYPVMGESKFRFDWVQDNVTDLDVNLVTIGLPGGSGTSVRSKKENMYDKLDKKHRSINFQLICCKNLMLRPHCKSRSFLYLI